MESVHGGEVVEDVLEQVPVPGARPDRQVADG